MEQNKVRTYILYAIGEIFLVVIGILIALQVNNWNEERIARQELMLSLQSIAKNISQDIEAAKKKIQETSEARILATQFLNHESADGISLQDLSAQLSAIFVEDYININNSGFEALKASGLMGKLRDTEFEALLYRYYVVVDEIRDNEISGNVFIEEMEAEAAKNGDFRNIFELFFLIQNEKDISNEKLTSAIYDVINSEAIYAAAGRVAITTDVSGGYSELIEVGTEFIELVEAID